MAIAGDLPASAGVAWNHWGTCISCPVGPMFIVLFSFQRKINIPTSSAKNGELMIWNLNKSVRQTMVAG